MRYGFWTCRHILHHRRPDRWACPARPSVRTTVTVRRALASVSDR